MHWCYPDYAMIFLLDVDFCELNWNVKLILFYSALLHVVFVANYIQQRQLQMMLIWTYFVKWPIPVVVFILSFLLLNHTTTISDRKNMYV